jgi:hypothetical protein
MSISPFSARPASSREPQRRPRLALLIAAVGISATLLAYAISPGLRHAVSHATHSVKHAVSNVLDHDRAAKRARALHSPAPAPGLRSHRPQSSSSPTRAPSSTSAGPAITAP